VKQPVRDNTSQPGREVYRSPVAIAIWWLWVLFAVANLIDLAVQGRDHLSLVAAFTLLFITGIVHAGAQRPRVIVSPDALTIVNPLRDHRIDWPAVAAADSTDLLRIRCEWPDGPETEATGIKDTEAPAPHGTKVRVIYAWAVHSSRRRQFAAETRAKRQAQRGGRSRAIGGFGGAGLGLGGTYGSPANTAPEPDPLTLDASKIAASLTEHASRARADNPGTRAIPPVATWHWPGVAAILVPGLALLIVALT
jgi:hypothetical protein